MIETMRQLLELEGIDAEIAKVDAALESIEAERVLLVREEANGAEVLERANEQLASREREERVLEGQVRDQEVILERLGDRSGQVSSKQAYDALVQETEGAREIKSTLETQALEILEIIDESRSSQQEAEGALSEVTLRAEARRSELAGDEGEAQGARASLLERRAKEAERVDVKALARYERVLLKRRPAVSVLERDSCPACHTSVPAQRLIEIRRANEIFACADCHRLLLPGHAFED